MAFDLFIQFLRIFVKTYVNTIRVLSFCRQKVSTHNSSVAVRLYVSFLFYIGQGIDILLLCLFFGENKQLECKEWI